MANITPKEIWVEIWRQVDFRTLQKSCTLVCKDWFGGIRGSTSLSGQMALNNRQKSLEDINLVLSHWEKLRIVRMSSEMSSVELLQLATHPSLEKIIFPQEYELGLWGKVTKVCFDLRNKCSETTSIENIVELHLLDFFEEWHWQTVHNEVHQPFLKRFKKEDNSLEPLARMMLNLETLHIFSGTSCDPEITNEEIKMRYFARFFHGLQHCKNLSELILFGPGFGEYTNYTPNIKKLEITGNCEFQLEELDWIANLEKLEILKLEYLRFEDKEIDIKDFTVKMFGKLTNLTILELTECSLMYEPAFLTNIHDIIPSLETLIMNSGYSDSMYPMNIEYLIDVLDSIADIKTLYIKDEDSHGAPFYLLNNKCFDRTLPNDLDEDQISAIFHTAFDIINKKFSIESTSLEILDSKSGWSIKKLKEKSPTLTQLPFKCSDDTEEDGDDRICTEFFQDKTAWEEHVAARRCYRFPSTYL